MDDLPAAHVDSHVRDGLTGLSEEHDVAGTHGVEVHRHALAGARLLARGAWKLDALPRENPPRESRAVEATLRGVAAPRVRRAHILVGSAQHARRGGAGSR